MRYYSLLKEYNFNTINDTLDIISIFTLSKYKVLTKN